MELFSLPHTAKVNRVIPKNAFDSYTTAKQKKLFTELISRITWTHKLSPDTINLEAKDIKEVQIFKVELKVKQDIQTVLDIIDKSIPYSIIFVVEYASMIYLSTSSKHTHPINEDNAVIDWTFKTEWFKPSENKYTLQLKKSIDTVYYDFCRQLSSMSEHLQMSFKQLIEYQQQKKLLEKEIVKIRDKIKLCNQFNLKVELNISLKQKLSILKSLEIK